MKNYENKKNQIQNKEIVKISRKKLRQFGTLAMLAGALGGWFGHDAYKSHQENHPPEIFQKSQTEGLDNSEIDFSELEKISDNYLMELNKESKYVVFGPEPLFTYLVAKEREINAVRMIMVSKINNISSDKIRERLRETYA